MAAKVTVRELVTKLTIGGNAGDKLAKFGLQMSGIKAGLGVLVGVVKVVSKATIGLVDDVTAVGDSIAKTSREIGIGAKSFQRLSFAAERSGVPLRNLRKGLQNIQKNMRDASIAAGEGKKTGFTKALAEVGLRLKDLEGLNAEEKLGLIGEAMSEVTDKGRRMAIAQKILGEKAGPLFASLLAEGTEGIKALGDEAERLGLVMDEDALAASEAFQDSMTNMNSVLKGIKQTVGIALIPIIQKSIDKFKDWLLLNRAFVTEKFEKGVKVLTKAFSFLLDNIDEIVGGFKSLGELSSDVLEFFRELSEAVGGVKNLLKLAAIAWGTYRAAALAATLGLSLTPIGALGFALAGIAAAFLAIETSADRARKARFRFEAGASSADKPVNEKQVRQDANAIVKGIRSGRDRSAALRKRAASTSKEQATQTFSTAERLLKRGQIREDTGLGFSVLKTVSLGNLPGELGSLEELINQTRADRIAAREAREAGPGETDVDFLGGLFAENISNVPTGGGGRRFKPIGDGDGKKGTKGRDKETDQLLADAIKSGALPEAAALLTSTQPPIIIPITNINVQMDVDASMEFDGVAGEDADSFIERVREVATDVLGTEFRSAIDELRPQLAR